MEYSESHSQNVNKEKIFSHQILNFFFASSVFTQKRKLVIMEFWVRIWKKSRKWQIFVAIGTNYSTLLRTEKSFKFLMFFWSPRPLKVCGKSSNAADFIGKSFFRVQLNAVYVWEVCYYQYTLFQNQYFVQKFNLANLRSRRPFLGQLRPFEANSPKSNIVKLVSPNSPNFNILKLFT